MQASMWSEEEEIRVRVHELFRGPEKNEETTFWTVSILRGSDEFTMYLHDKTDIQVLIDLLKTEARKIGAYIDG